METMDEELFYLGVRLPVDDVIGTLHSVLPNGLRQDHTITEWGGSYRRRNQNGDSVSLLRYMDGYGTTALVLVERITEITYVVLAVAPDDYGSVAAHLRLTLTNAFQEVLVESRDSMAGRP